MHYHIGNMLIHQEFQSGKSCPLCRIRNILENRLAEQYLNDAVMEDDQRKKVNERGFCAHHTQMMLARKNKLSLALQHVTRITTLKGKLEVTDDAKRAGTQSAAQDRPRASSSKNFEERDYTDEQIRSVIVNIDELEDDDL